MENMNLFEQETAQQDDFLKAYEQFLTDLHINRNQYRFYNSSVEKYLRILYDKGEFVHSNELDAIVRACFDTYADEHSQNEVLVNGYLHYLLNGASLQELSGITLGDVIALNDYRDMSNGDYDIHKELRLVRLLGNKKVCSDILHATGRVGFGYHMHGLLLFDLVRFTANGPDDTIDIMEKNFHDGIWIVSDCYNFAFLISIGYSESKALDIISHFAKKGYSGKSILLLEKYVSEIDNLPICDTLMNIIISHELEKNVSYGMIKKLHSDLSTFIKNNVTEEISQEYLLAIIESVYKAGFSVGFVAKDSPNQANAIFVNMIIAAISMTNSFKKRFHLNHYRASLSGDARILGNVATINEKELIVLKPDVLLDSLRFLYANQQLNSLDSSTELDYDFMIYVISTWLNSFCSRGKCSWLLDTTSIDRVMHKPYTELQIMYNGAIICHLPKDFFIEYSEEIKSLVEANNPKYCYVFCASSANKKNNDILVISFSDSQQVSVQTRTNSLDFTIDLQAKRDLVFNSGCRFDMPILKIMLSKYFREHGKSTDLLETLDLQTLVGMIQVLILQDSEAYKTLFKRTDSFLSGFKAMRWCVRSDDNFYSAVLRYIVNSANIFSTFYDTKLSTDLESYVMLEEKQVPLLSIFSGDKMLVEYLREHKNSVQICVRGDVVHFE